MYATALIVGSTRRRQRDQTADSDGFSIRCLWQAAVRRLRRSIGIMGGVVQSGTYSTLYTLQSHPYNIARAELLTV